MSSPILLDGGRVLVRCKHCRQVLHGIHRGHHLKECRPYLRKQKLNRIAFTKDGRSLYAIAIQRFNPTTGQWLPEMHYTHAHGPAHAKRNFFSNESNRQRVHIVDVGLAIGMFAVDRDGMQLSAD